VRERALGPEVGDAHRLLERARRRDDLAEHRRESLGGNGPGLPSRSRSTIRRSRVGS
jgi:hypothetical protein